MFLPKRILLIAVSFIVTGSLLPVQGEPEASPVAQEEQEPTVLETQRIPEVIPVLWIQPEAVDRRTAIRAVELLAQVLELPLAPEELRERDQTKEDVFRFYSGEHKFVVFRASGGIQYRHEALYQLTAEDASRGALSEDEILVRARGDLERLAQEELISLDEIDYENVHIAHQATQSATRTEDGRTEVSEAIKLDTRVDFTRQIGALRIAGNGIRLIYANDGRLLGLDLVWRKLDNQNRQELPLAISREEALQLFQDQVGDYVNSGGNVDLLQAELVYLDPDPRESVEVFQPIYLFMYQVRTPIEGNDEEFIVSKKQFVMISATKTETRE